MSASAEHALPHVRYAGDAALLLDVGAAMGRPARQLDPDVNDCAIGAAAAVRAAAIAGVRDIVPTFRSVAVYFDPLTTDVRALATALAGAVRPAEAGQFEPEGASGFSRTVEIPVRYGGADGPDLEEVAAYAACSAADVVARHTGQAYRVYMLGFLPGFAYLGAVDASIAAPRRATPRARVPAGSVGIAGIQTGVYPQESPGGWQIIGRTDLPLFDAARERPSLLAPGDEVRFVVARPASHAPDTARPTSFANGTTRSANISRAITVVRPGLYTTIQDTGRWGHQAEGVPVAGPMDAPSHRMANLLAGNPPDAATLEITLAGLEVRVEQETTLAITGADLGALLEGAAVAMASPIVARAGAVMRFAGRRQGARAYLAFAGGIDVAPVLGSRATHVLSRLGGLDGRPLKAGDRLPLGHVVAPPGRVARTLPVHEASPQDSPHLRTRLRILPGPQLDLLPPGALESLTAAPFTVSPQSDRMGYRLLGGRLPAPAAGTMLSDATFAGALQVPPSGEPILLMVDRQTTGGYPQAAVVISADLPAAGQLAPGDEIAFELCTRAQAMSALIAQEGRLLAFR